MARPLTLLLLLVLAGCSSVTTYQRPASPCDVSEASMACQVERYQNVNV